MINYLGQKLTNGYEFPKILLYKDQWEHFIIFIFSYSKFIFPWKDECFLGESHYLLLLASANYLWESGNQKSVHFHGETYIILSIRDHILWPNLFPLP